MQPLQYAGDLTPEKTWETLKTDPNSVLIDVRTPEEWSWIGVPDLSSLPGRKLQLVPWQIYPDMHQNPDFVADVSKITKPEDDKVILLICRSGVRSAYGASLLTANGFKHCYNVAHGFEGDKDKHGHRGTVNGWKVMGMPWRQE
ncbi:MAG: rhodanese-like domain-containing protein [Rhodospirillaceae bacterium]|nr:rhodanese-like domain-containing protein [Rhodospirillaceae bacterium]